MAIENKCKKELSLVFSDIKGGKLRRNFQHFPICYFYYKGCKREKPRNPQNLASIQALLVLWIPFQENTEQEFLQKSEKINYLDSWWLIVISTQNP